MEPSCPRCESYDPKNPQGRGAMCRQCLLNGLSKFSPTKQALEMEVIDLRAELAALKAGRVVLPGLSDEQAEEIARKFAIETSKYVVFRIWAIAQKHARAVSPSDILQPGQVAVEWIACEDRLPEDGQSVAFISKCDRDEFYRGRILGGRYVAGEFGGFTVPGLMTDASHWFPMPPVPDALRSQGEAGR